MPTKKISIPPKPNKSVDEWVESRVPVQKKVKKKFLNFPVPAEVHQNIKSTAFHAGISMNRLLQELVIKKYGVVK